MGYWGDPENRQRYVRWLGRRLGFRKPEDWYQISTDDFRRNCGGGVLMQGWGGSAIAAVKECFPGYDWKEWLFARAPIDFWKVPKNRWRYMKWLGQQLGVRRPSDWYRVNQQDFRDNEGMALLDNYYEGTISLLIMSYLPNYDWKPWLFCKTPKGFWHERKNRRRYLTWLGKKLGFQSVDDWHNVTEQDFLDNHGIALLRLYGSSPLAVLRDCFPRHRWDEWMFAKVPVGFWDDPANRKRYVRWLGKKLGFKRLGDWNRATYKDFAANYGGGLVARYRSHMDVVKECVPRFRKP